MAFLVCHMQKHGSGALGGIQSHNERERESKTNPDIDKSKSSDNYSLVECNNYRKAIQANISELHLKKAVRKDAVLACSFVVTSSQDFFKRQSPEETKAFFADTVEFFKERYGEKNVISAKVHMDEATPHMHLLLTPIRDEKLSARAIFDRKELRDLQTELHAKIGRSRGLERGREGSGKAHLSENRFKAEKALEAAKAAEQKLAELTPKILKASEVEKLQGKKSLFGNALKGVSYTDFLSLKQTAEAVDKMAQRSVAAEQRADLAEQKAAEIKTESLQEYAKIQQERKSLERDRAVVEKAKSETPSALLQRQNAELKAENKAIKTLLDSVRSFIKFNSLAIKSAVERMPGAPERFENIKNSLGLGKNQSRGNER